MFVHIFSFINISVSVLKQMEGVLGFYSSWKAVAEASHCGSPSLNFLSRPLYVPFHGLFFFPGSVHCHKQFSLSAAFLLGCLKLGIRSTCNLHPDRLLGACPMKQSPSQDHSHILLLLLFQAGFILLEHR